MSWFQGLFVGLFTRHLTTKLLALLLSIGLFGFVQASLTGTREVTRLNLEVSLAEELRAGYVLLNSKFVVSGLMMRGELSKVDSLARLYRNSFLRVPIDQRILNVYGRDRNGGIEIPIDSNLFRDEVLFGKDITVERLQSDAPILVNKAVDKATVRVEVAPKLQSVVHSLYEGQLAFAANMTVVQLRGPASAFRKDLPVIVVGVRGNVADQISAYPMPGETGTITFPGTMCEIQWEDGGIAEPLVAFLRITPEGLTTELTPGEFRQRLEIACKVTKRKEEKRLENVPIEIRYPTPRGEFDLLVGYDSFPPFTDAALSAGSMPLLDVRMPAALAADTEFLKRLVVVLNAAAAEEGEANVTKVPFYLDVRDHVRDEDLAKLRQVAITGGVTEAEFRKKP
jgi:hypothetical protein